jgi:hypothetical protein
MNEESSKPMEMKRLDVRIHWEENPGNNRQSISHGIISLGSLESWFISCLSPLDLGCNH